MSRPELSPDLRRFIVTNVPSVPYLEGILLMRAEPQRPWTVREMARRLYVAEPEVASLLEAAHAHGIAQRKDADVPTYCYRPQSDELSEMLDRLAAHYASDVVTVATLIHGRGDKRVQLFADAFRWRKSSD